MFSKIFLFIGSLQRCFGTLWSHFNLVCEFCHLFFIFYILEIVLEITIPTFGDLIKTLSYFIDPYSCFSVLKMLSITIKFYCI